MNKKAKIMELLNEIEKQAIQFRHPVLAHAIGGGLLGATAGAALPVTEKEKRTNPLLPELGIRIARSISSGVVGAVLGGGLKGYLNDGRVDRLWDMARKSRKTIRFDGKPVRVLDTKYYDPIRIYKLMRRMNGIL